MDLNLTDRLVLVVGGTGFIGSAVAETLRAEGATVVVASRHEGADVRMDAADDASVADALDEITRTRGALDGVVITAAPSARTLDPAKNADPAQVLAAIEGKALTFLRVANAVLPGMADRGSGRVVGISGQNALLTGSIAGSVRNAALNIAAKNLADAYSGTGVTVNTVNPGIVTESPAAEAAAGRPGESTPGDTARLIAFLLSPAAGAISGESIAVGHRVRGVV